MSKRAVTEEAPIAGEFERVELDLYEVPEVPVKYVMKAGDPPPVEQRYLTGFFMGQSNSPGLVLAPNGDVILVAPGGSRTVLTGGGGGGLPTGWQVDTPYVGDFLYGPYPAESGQRTVQFGVNGDTDADGLILAMTCFAGTYVELKGLPGEAHLYMYSDSGPTITISTESGVYIDTSASSAISVSGGAGATVALDAGGLQLTNLSQLVAVGDQPLYLVGYPDNLVGLTDTGAIGGSHDGVY